MFQTVRALNKIGKLVCENGGSKTQMSAEIHEKKILEIFRSCNVKQFDPSNGKSRENSAVFRKWFKSSTGIDSKSNPQESYPIISRVDDIFKYITPKTPMVIHQPHGSQNFPDMILFKIENDKIHTLYIECKSPKPAFNNNPPKKNSNCIYICGNRLYNGYFLRSHKCVDMYNDFLEEYKRLIEKYKNMDDYDMTPVFYKKNEFKSFPPPFFNGKETLNFRLNKLLIKNILE